MAQIAAAWQYAVLPILRGCVALPGTACSMYGASRHIAIAINQGTVAWPHLLLLDVLLQIREQKEA
jgi:hypothetical protein